MLREMARVSLVSIAISIGGCATRYVATECPPPVPMPVELSQPPPQESMQQRLQAIYLRWLGTAPSSTTDSQSR
ncbi:MAG: hypothetical protein IT178_16390 [Acidobacteria bacterium]|nr:hypothetical protein [Acidobacteriota bacterium]